MIPRDKLEPGDMILIHDGGFNLMGWAIRRISHSFWNHVMMVTEPDYVVEAQGRGVLKTPLSYYDDPRYSYKIIRMRSVAYKSIKEWEAGIATAIANITAAIGHKYDWGGVAYLGWVYLWKATIGYGNPKNNLLENRERFFCSELVAEAYFNTSSVIKGNLFAGKIGKDTDVCTPRDISRSLNTFFCFGIERD